MLQKSGRLVLWEAMFILELHSAETQENICSIYMFSADVFYAILTILEKVLQRGAAYAGPQSSYFSY